MEPHHPAVRADRFAVDEPTSRAANRRDWDAYADEYQATHGAFLGDTGFVWGPEGIPESELRILGEVSGKTILEVGCGAAQCCRWLVTQGAQAVGLDLAHRQLQHALRINDDTGVVVPVVEGTGTDLPFADDSFDVIFSSFGALQFVADIDQAVAEVARVLRAGGRFAFSITHPTRWMFPDDPTEAGLLASQSYWDRTPYVEVDDDSGRVSYVEHHRTIGDWVRILAGHGFRLLDIAEPQWPEGHDRVWGGWSEARGVLTPGTAIYVAEAAPDS